MYKSIILALLLTAVESRAQNYTHTFIFLNSKPDKEMISEEAAAELQKKHLENIDRLVQEGKLVVAGPFEGGGGIFILNTAEVSVAKEWLATDPAVKASRWNIDILPVAFSLGGACLVQEPYEMVSYNFIRVNYINEIANYKMNSTSSKIWDVAKTGDATIIVGQFPQYDGGIIVYQGDEQSWADYYSADQISLEMKKLWVARGSFCEKN